MDAAGEVVVSHVAGMSCKQSAEAEHNVNVINDNEDEATSPCGISGSASAAVTHSHTIQSTLDARDIIVNGGCHAVADSFNVNGNSNGPITSTEIEELGELTEAIKFCDEEDEAIKFCDEEDETEIFFGAITEKEQRKASKYGNRRTAVFQPKFRHDRSLMRYTDYHVLAKVLEDEEEQDEEAVATAKEESSSSSSSKVLNGFQHELDDIHEANEQPIDESQNSGNSHDTNNESLTNSSSSDFQVSMRSPNLDVYRIVHLSDISADEDSANSSRNSSVYFSSGNALLNRSRDVDAVGSVTSANSLSGSYLLENVSESTREAEPSRESDQVTSSADEDSEKVVAKPETEMGMPALDVEVVSAHDVSLSHNQTPEQSDVDVDKPVNSSEIESVCSDHTNEESSKMTLEQDDANKEAESDSKESELNDATQNKLEVEGLVQTFNGLDLQLDSLDGSRPGVNTSAFVDISVDSLDASPGKLIIAEGPDLPQDNSIIEDISQDSLEISKVNPTEVEQMEKDSRLCDTSFPTVFRESETGNNSRDLFADDSPFCAIKNDDVEADTGATPAIPKGSNTSSNIVQDSRATDRQQRLPRIAMSTPISLHASACHRSAFSAFITPIKQPSESSLVLGNTMDTAGSSSQLEEGSDLALTRANVCHIGSMGSGLKTDDSQSCLAKSTDQSEVLFKSSFLASESNVGGDEQMGPAMSEEKETDAGNENSESSGEVGTFPEAVENKEKLNAETTDTMQRELLQTEASPIKQVATCQSDVTPKSSVENFPPLSEDAPKTSMENISTPSDNAPESSVTNFSPPSEIAPKSSAVNFSPLSENAEVLNSPVVNRSQSSIVFTETRFSPNIFNRSLASPSQTASMTDLSQLEDSDVIVFKEVGFSPTVQNRSLDQPEARRVHCFSPSVPHDQSGLDIVTVSACDMSLSNVTRSSSADADADDEKDEGVGSGDEELLTPPSASLPDSSPSLVPRPQQLTENPSATAPVTKLFPQAASSVLTQSSNSPMPGKQKAKSPFPPRVKSTPKVRAKAPKPVGTPHGRTPTPTVRYAFGRSVQTAAKTPPAPNPKLLRHTPVSTGRKSPAAVSKPNPPVFKGGTPRYLPGQKKQTLTQSPSTLKRVAPPKFDLDDSPAAKSPANRATLEEKKYKLEMLQEEKRRVQEKLAKMQSPLASTGKSPTRPTVSPVPVRMPLTPTSADNLPRVRYKDTQSPSQALYLNPAELEAVTKIHTLCNAQQISKIVTKARAGGSPVTTSKHRIAYKEASKLQWQEDLTAEGSDKHLPVGTETPAKSILHIRPAEDIFPYNDQQPSPVVIRKLAKRTNTLCPSKT